VVFFFNRTEESNLFRAVQVSLVVVVAESILSGASVSFVQVTSVPQ
jgi:hypothetical protein